MNPVLKSILHYALLLIRMLGISAGLLVLQNKPENADMIAVVLDSAWFYMSCLALAGISVFFEFANNLRSAETS